VTSDNTSTSSLALAGLHREFGWPCWRDGDQYYARHPDTPAGHHDAQGEDPAGLREAILLARSPAPAPSPRPVILP
jgi:hypothetical protein